MPNDAYHLILSYRDYYGTYHHHKEQIAFAAAALYLSGATAVGITGSDFWNSFSPQGLLFGLLAVSGATGFLFVGWQLRKRESAADMVGACTNLAARWLTGSPSELDLQPTPYGHYLWPRALVDELETIAARRSWFRQWLRSWFRGPRLSEALTYVMMLAWTGIAIWRIVL